MKKINLIGLFIVLFSLLSCSNNPGDDKNEEIPTTETSTKKKPSVTTIEVLNLEADRATITAKVIDKGSTSVTQRGVCINTTGVPTIENGISFPETVIKASGEFTVELSELQDDTKYYARAYAVNDAGAGYGNQIIFNTNSANVPVLKLGDVTVSGVHDLFVDVAIIASGDYPILESGVTWGVNEKPTIDLNKNTIRMKDNGLKFKQRITGLQELTSYYVRPYVKTLKGVTYGDQIKVSTIKSGKFTFYMWEDPAADTDTKAAYTRIRAAFEKATSYYNNFTSIEKHVTVNYSPGTPTADANFNGWINFGANPSYQRTGTAMHEMDHTVGVGTHWQWGQLMKGTWQGSRAKEILRMMTDAPTAEIYGDGMHFWPYGINGAHEDTGEEMLYIINALVLQGIKTDGLPSK